MASSAAVQWSDATERVPRSVLESASAVLRAADKPARAAFLARALTALAGLAMALDEDSLGDAAGAESGYESLLMALESPEALAVLRQADPLAPAKLRGLRAKQDLLLREGGVLSAEAVAQHLGLSRQAVNKRRLAGTLIAVNTGRRGYAYPAWQLGEEGTIAGLETVLSALGSHDPWMRLAFFLAGNTGLGGDTPLEALRRGELESVLRAARLYGEQVAA